MQASRTSRAPAPGARSPRLLPPILVDGEGHSHSSSGPHSPLPHRSPKVSPAGPKLWSYYHRGCLAKDTAMNWGGVDRDKKRPGNHVAECRRSKSRSLPHVPFNVKDGDALAVTAFLDHNREFMEAYVTKNVPLNEIERWMFKKISKTYADDVTSDTLTLTKSEDISKTSKKIFFTEVLKSLQDDPNEQAVLWELARCVTLSIGVDAYRIYKLFPDHPSFVQYFVADDTGHPDSLPKHLVRADLQQVTLVLEVARRGAPWRLSRHEDHRFPDTPHALFKIKKVNEANHILYQPVLNSANKTAYVIEMWRNNEPFTASEEEISSGYVAWGGLALHYCNLYLDKKRERNMSDFLLDVVKAIFEEMVSLDQLIKRILEFAQKLVNADRASLFLVDYRNFELVSTVFDLKFEPGQSVEKKEIRMPINRGIAGHVALSGETMNIPDAYSDYRFNRQVDEATGYKTISILCMPIKVQGKVIGVVQMVNKRNDDSFHHEDEVSFEIFSTFFGLALHHARLYDRIMRKEQKYRVALEVLSYHNTCRENEVQAIMGDKERMEVNLNDFYLDPYQFNEFEKCKAVIIMFNDLFDLSKFDIITVTRFILTVKKNYRTVPYHNFDHGWSVAHCMYVIVKNDVRKRYSYRMRLALFVASLCHDLDHRGYTNKYMSETASPLAAMYTTSTLEHHHFNITVTILQQDGHNIFAAMSSEEYKEVLGLIRQCILATDLAAFFPNLAKIKELLSAETQTNFNWAIDSHRELAMAISMTAADLSASTKPWQVQIKTVKVIFEEFYDQGDKERAAGRDPIPMMDRDKPDERPASQVGFLSQICTPCYNILYRILPNTKPMYVMALKNLHNWKAKADRILRKLERNDDESCEESDIEDVPEHVLLDGVEVVEEETSASEGDAIRGEMEGIDGKEQTKMIKSTETSTISWDDEESTIESDEKVGGGVWKNIEGVTWAEDDGVMMNPSNAETAGNEKKRVEDL